MKNNIFKKALPHFVAIIIFLVISVFFCKPALEGNVLNQSDIISVKGMAQNGIEYKQKNGHLPLWNPNLFSGMPNYQIAMEGKSILPDLTKIFTLGLPKPINFFFLACISFYLLCLALGVNVVIAILGSLSFAFCTYNPVIISVGHDTKMMAIAYMPALLAGLILIYEKKYWIGLALTTMFASCEIGVNHPQINFYFSLVATAVTIVYVIQWIKKKEWKHFATSASLTLISAIVGIFGNAVLLLPNYEYAKATMRGGKDISITGDSVTATKTFGLDTSYAFQYSLGKAESFVILMPNAFGGSSYKKFDENSDVVKKLTARGVPENSAIQLASSLPKYWGGIDGVGTAGPPYIGAIVCLLALIGFVLYKKPLRWGLLAVTILGIMMAWGKYLPGFNTFLFNHLPLYNKFRAPSMTMVITEFTIPIVAVLGLQYLLYRDNSRELLKTDFKKILYAVGGLFGLLLIMYLMMDYSSSIDKDIINAYTDKNGSDEMGRLIVSGLKSDRSNMFGGQILRTFGFAILVVGFLYGYIRNLVKPLVIGVALTVISTIDLLSIDKDYLNSDNYVSPDEIVTQNFAPTVIDQIILKDTSDQRDFRVFDITNNPYSDARPSYFHKSIGGYHPAKLRIYQDIIDKYLSGPFNQNVLNMLNMKYMITGNSQNGQPLLSPNPNAFGPCWLVKNVKIVDGPVQEIKSIGNADLKDTAFVEKSFAKEVVQPILDSTANLKLAKFDNDVMQYSFNSSTPQFGVFSEVYYPFGWNAYIDGKKVEYCRTNYILRGLSIPAGKHEIKFVFEPSSFKNGVRIAYTASFLILIFFFGGLFLQWRSDKKKITANA